MQLGMVGLGRMGANMVRRLKRGGPSWDVFERNPEAVRSLETEGADGAHSLSDFVGKLPVPRAAWAMVPAGPPTEAVVRELAGRMTAGDVIVDGGNSHFKDDVRRLAALADAGTSGGLWGIDRGYCLMIGGTAEAVSRLEPVLRTLAPGRGEVPRTPGRKDGGGAGGGGGPHCGPAGAGP